jgi:hypothetical protein
MPRFDIAINEVAARRAEFAAISKAGDIEGLIAPVNARRLTNLQGFTPLNLVGCGGAF